MAVSLMEAFQGFRCRATDHYPKSNVYLHREYHRVSPLFDFRGLEATNARHGTKVPTGDQGQFKVVHPIITAIVEYPLVEAAPFPIARTRFGERRERRSQGCRRTIDRPPRGGSVREGYHREPRSSPVGLDQGADRIVSSSRYGGRQPP